MPWKPDEGDDGSVGSLGYYDALYGRPARPEAFAEKDRPHYNWSYSMGAKAFAKKPRERREIEAASCRAPPTEVSLKATPEGVIGTVIAYFNDPDLYAAYQQGQKDLVAFLMAEIEKGNTDAVSHDG